MGRLLKLHHLELKNPKLAKEWHPKKMVRLHLVTFLKVHGKKSGGSVSKVMNGRLRYMQGMRAIIVLTVLGNYHQREITLKKAILNYPKNGIREIN